MSGRHTAKPFTWVIAFTVAPLWVQDGFALCDERAASMLGHELDCARGDEFSARVLEAPSALQIASIQGYTKDSLGGGQAVRELRDGCPSNGTIHGALITARKLLDSVAFVSVEGDTAAALAKIDAALAAIDARQGEAVEMEA